MHMSHIALSNKLCNFRSTRQSCDKFEKFISNLDQTLGFTSRKSNANNMETSTQEIINCGPMIKRQP